MRKEKKHNAGFNLDYIIGGNMKDLINGVDGKTDSEKKEASDTSLPIKEASVQTPGSNLYSFTKDDFENNIEFFLRTKGAKKQIYIDLDIIKKLEKLQYNIKYQSGGNQFTSLGTLISSILKTFFDAYEADK